MGTARARTAAITGIEGHLVDVEADVDPGPPALILTGLPETALRETRDRVRAAIVNSGERWPDSKITIGLSPASLSKRGSGSDLAIAAAVIAANGDLPALPADTVFLAELGLDGRLRPVPGLLPAALAAARAGITTIVVAPPSRAEAAQVPGATVITAAALADVTAWLRGGPPPSQESPGPVGDDGTVPLRPDLADVLGQAGARQALEISAAGGHHLSLTGPAGTGKTMLAERLPSILPALDQAAALEVTAIHSVAGIACPGNRADHRPAVHRTAPHLLHGGVRPVVALSGLLTCSPLIRKQPRTPLDAVLVASPEHEAASAACLELLRIQARVERR